MSKLNNHKRLLGVLNHLYKNYDLISEYTPDEIFSIPLNDAPPLQYRVRIGVCQILNTFLSSDEKTRMILDWSECFVREEDGCKTPVYPIGGIDEYHNTVKMYGRTVSVDINRFVNPQRKVFIKHCIDWLNAKVLAHDPN